jgi:hypothetical protein
VNRWINLLFYQATWISAVAGAGHGVSWPGLVVLAAFAIWQLATTRWPRADATLLLAISVAGFGIDSLLQQAGLFRFAVLDLGPDAAPLWMIVLWSSFALSLNHSMAFLHGRPLVAALLGAIGAPFAYWAAGSGWNALVLGTPVWRTVAIVGAVWFVLMPLLAGLSLRWRRFDERPGLAASRGGT